MREGNGDSVVAMADDLLSMGVGVDVDVDFWDGEGLSWERESHSFGVMSIVGLFSQPIPHQSSE